MAQERADVEGRRGALSASVMKRYKAEDQRENKTH